ncbi:MAG: acyl-CoA thioesterase [Sphingomonadaceae bacterium]
MSIDGIIAASRPAEGGFTVTIPDGWRQGRTTYGGLSSAIGRACARRLVPDLPPLRSAQISFVGPVSGDVTFRARLLRQGRNATWVAVEASNDEGATGFAATYLFMGAVESGSLHLHDRPAPDDLIPVDQAVAFAHPLAPSFIENGFDVRFALPWREKVPELCWWVKLKAPPEDDMMGESLMVADALPPGIFTMVGIGAPISSMMWQLNYLTARPHTRDHWWLLRSTADYAEKGCSNQQMTVWNADGEAVIAGIQSVAVFG